MKKKKHVRSKNKSTIDINREHIICVIFSFKNDMFKINSWDIIQISIY